MRRRAFILVMDSFGIGGAPDAARFGDEGADTFGHIAAYMANHPNGPLNIPNLARLGLAAASRMATGRDPEGIVTPARIDAAWGVALERSRGKDTPSGHWEMAGVPVMFDWGYFPPGPPSFPRALTDSLIARARLPGLLGNRHASGTRIVDELGAEHVRSGKPIVYTSADSVFQIAAHEESFGLARLYEVCAIARELVDGYNVGRVIARPFVGREGGFRRTANRRDYAVPPPAPTLLDRLTADGGDVIAVGKVSDIFAHRGISRTIKADGNMALVDATLRAAREAGDRSLVFANYVDFDTLYGHRRDVTGYAAALEAFDVRLPEVEAALSPGDIAIITADHGCDPTWRGSDHTRECVPVLAFGPAVTPGSLGRRGSLADIGASLALHLGLPALAAGESFLKAKSATGSSGRA
ncbi:MAG TPA: phosphopentomutase [Alphaproteobacteria bacterium]|nr:phosphopentomutase [Alphaproteobacteria bacterium]